MQTTLDVTGFGRQHMDVWTLMRDGTWRTLQEISIATGWPEASVSARLRDFRKREYENVNVLRRLRKGEARLYEYRVQRRGRA